MQKFGMRTCNCTEKVIKISSASSLFCSGNQRLDLGGARRFARTFVRSDATSRLPNDPEKHGLLIHASTFPTQFRIHYIHQTLQVHIDLETMTVFLLTSERDRDPALSITRPRDLLRRYSITSIISTPIISTFQHGAYVRRQKKMKKIKKIGS